MAGEQLSFEERTIQRLEAEMSKTETPVEEEAPEGIPPDATESEDEGILSESEVDEEAEDTEDGTPEEEIEDSTDWEQRYKDAQSELTRYQQNREKDARELSDGMSEILQTRYALEDRMKEQAEQGEYLVQMATGNAEQYRHINWSQVPPDQLPQMQQAAQQAFMQEQTFKNAFSQQQQRAKEVREEMLKREASIARQRLTRSIPDFDDAYPEMARYAQDRGMDIKRFNELVDPALMEMIYDSMQMRKSSPEIETQTKARPPKSRLPKKQPRGIDGKFQKADEAFRKTTDTRQRGRAWEEKTRLRLSKEQQRR